MLFMTNSILSSSKSMKNTMKKDLIEMTPVDINLDKTANLPEKYLSYGTYGKEIISTPEAREDSKYPISYTLEQNGYDMKNLKDITEIMIYATNELTMGISLVNYFDEAKKSFPVLLYDLPEDIVKISDYNKIAQLYGMEKYSLNDNEYIIICNYDNIASIRNEALKNNKTITINGEKYYSKYDECQEGFIYMSTSHTNTGIILVPDSCNLKEEWKAKYFLAANYNAETEEDLERIEATLVETGNSGFMNNIVEQKINMDGMSKIALVESSVGVATMVLFIAIYLGIIFLIASSAILALKQLTESSDNKQRYIILRKIGCDEKMINQALFRQIAVFFILPLIFAIIHSIFGIQFVMSMMSVLVSPKQLLPSVIATVVIIGVVYGLYFLATYLGSKNIIKDE